MDYKNEWLNACFNAYKQGKTALVQRGENDWIGPYTMDIAYLVSADLGGADIIDSETGELLNA